MSIIAYVGLPGSGKSYDVVANQIMPALEQGRRVVTNIPLQRDAVRDITRQGEIVDLPLEVIMAEPAKIDEYATPGCLLVIDELWRLWPAGQKTDKIPQPYKSLLAEHRHRVDSEGRSMQIVFVTQDLAQIAAFARQLVEQTYHHTKLTSVGATNSYRIDVFHGAITGAVPPINNRLREIFGKYKPEIFKLYQSHTMSESKTSGANESAMDARGNVLKRWQVWAGAAFAIGCVTFGVVALADIVGGFGGGETSEASPPTAVTETREPTSSEVRTFAQPVQQPRKANPVAALERRTAPGYRVVGTIENNDDTSRSVALLTDGKRTIPIPFSQCRPLVDGDLDCKFDGYSVGLFGVHR